MHTSDLQDYDNSYLPNNKTIAEQRVLYAADAHMALLQLRRANPILPRLVGNLEGPSHSLTAAQTHVLFELLPPSKRHAGFPIEALPSQTEVLRAHTVAWGLPMETFPLSEAGNPFYELYFRPDRFGKSVPLISMMSYPRPGNAQVCYTRS